MSDFFIISLLYYVTARDYFSLRSRQSVRGDCQRYEFRLLTSGMMSIHMKMISSPFFDFEDTDDNSDMSTVRKQFLDTLLLIDTLSVTLLVRQHVRYKMSTDARSNGAQDVLFFKRHECISEFISDFSDDERRVNSTDHDAWRVFSYDHDAKLFDLATVTSSSTSTLSYSSGRWSTNETIRWHVDQCVYLCVVERQVSHHYQYSSLSVQRTLHSVLNVWWRCQRSVSHHRTNQVSYTRFDHPDTIRVTARVQNMSSFTWSTRITCSLAVIAMSDKNWSALSDMDTTQILEIRSLHSSKSKERDICEKTDMNLSWIAERIFRIFEK